MQTVTYSQELPITDADGKPVVYRKVVPVCDGTGKGIYPGSVLENVKDKDRGVVVRIVKAGDYSLMGVECVGDLNIQTRHGSTRITNKYSEWRHVPHAEQTYEERYESWLCVPFQEGVWSESKSREEQIAIDGIMSLLPRDIVDYGYGPFADSIENALRYLAIHLAELSKQHP